MATSPSAKPDLDALPTAPSRGDAPTVFRTRADAFVAALVTFRTQLVSLATWISTTAGQVYDNAVEAAASAGTATTKAGEAAASATAAAGSVTAAGEVAGADQWVSEAAYSIGDAVWSPDNNAVYRAITNHSGVATDPSLDATNWDAVVPLDEYAPLAGGVTLTGGFDSDEEPLGTITSGTVTPEVDGANEENFKTLTNNGAFTLAPPSTSSATTIRIRVINAASAGAITTSGFDAVFDPDSYATTNAKEYWFYIDHDSTRSTLTIREIV